MLIKCCRQLDQLENRVATDISTILTILTENRQSSSSFSGHNNSSGDRIRRGTSSGSPPRAEMSGQGHIDPDTQTTLQMSQRSTSQPTDISQVTSLDKVWIMSGNPDHI